MVAADYPFFDVMWSMLVFFLWIIWFWLLITVFGDIFRRHDISGWEKAAWLIFVIVLPYLGVFIYLIAQNRGMSERNVAQARAAQSQFDDHIKTVAGGAGPANEIAAARDLLASGAITQDEFETLKQKALAQA